MEAEERLLSLVLECPECNGAKRGTTIKREVFLGLLARDEDIQVYAGGCRHIRSLTAIEKNNLRKALDEGVL